MRDSSTIQISNETKKRLKSLRITQNESYENIILRLLDAKLYGREMYYSIKSLNDSCEIKAVVDWGSDDANLFFIDSDGDMKFNVPRERMGDVSQKEWNSFRKEITRLNNLVEILSILDYGNSIRAGELILKRIE